LEKEKQDIFEKIWSFFASVRLTIVVLIVLAITSIIGTIVEQQAEPARNIALLAKFFGDKTAPTVYNIFVKFGFMDMYHSWWFVTLLIIFSINLVVCTIERFPKTLRLVKNPIKPISENAIRSMPVKMDITLKTDIQKAKNAAHKSLSESRYRAFESTGNNSVQLYSQKGRYSRLGLYIVHISIILILIGAIIGARFGFDGYVNIPEGSTYAFALKRTGPLSKAEESERQRILDTLVQVQDNINMAVKRLGMPLDILYTRMEKYGIKPLDFAVRCNWYDTKYYSGTDMPQEFQSELVIIDDGKEVMKKVIEVNHPLTYKGYTFYQSSYGMLDRTRGVFILHVAGPDGTSDTLRLGFGDTFSIPNTGIKGTILNFSPALARDRVTGALTTYSENMVNPAVAIEFDIPGMEKFTGWILKRYPETGVLPDGSTITFKDYWGVEYTGLQVAKDPGVGLIYFASVVMTIGLYAAFFMSHRKVWVNIIDESHGKKKGTVKVLIGGSTSKNRLAFEREIEKITDGIKKEVNGGGKG
jgi:cytochrome c biogenesis protein